MLPAFIAASSALDLLNSLTSSSSKQSRQARDTSFDLPSSSSVSKSPFSDTETPWGRGNSGQSQLLSSSTMTSLFSLQSEQANLSHSTDSSRASPLKKLFAMLDGNSDGAISKSEFEDKLGAGGTNLANADKVFGKLDKDGDGALSMDELSVVMKGKGHHHPSFEGQGNADAVMRGLQGASTATTQNSDGSSTTTVSYADGSKVTMTSAASSASSAATSSYNYVEQLIQRQANALLAQNASTLSLSA